MGIGSFRSRLRAAALVVFAVVLVSVPAHASVFDFLGELMQSRDMGRVPGDQTTDKTRAVYLNGFPLFVKTGKTTRSVKEVLDHYQERFPGGALKEIVSKPVAVRKEGNETGSMLIFDVPDKATAMQVFDGKRTLLSAGPVRMVYARRVGLRTEYLVAWSDRRMPQSVVEPMQSGDAPGQDIPDVPRPAGTRSFSFAEPKAGYMLASYRVSERPEVALRGISVRLSGAGWTEDRVFQTAAVKRGKMMARFVKGDRDLVVCARPPRSERTETQIIYLHRDLS